MVQLPLILLAFLTFAAPLEAQDQKTPQELQIEGRWKGGGLETRVGKAPWVALGPDLLEQLRAAGAKPETPLLLTIPEDVPKAPLAELLKFLEKAKYSNVEVDGEVAVVVAPKPGKTPAPQQPPATPLRVEIRHHAPDCAPYKGPCCPNARHWSVQVDKTPCSGRAALAKALRQEAAAEPDRQIPRLSARPVTVRADAKAPAPLVLELGVLCEEAGFFKADLDGPAETGAKALDPGAPPVPVKDDDKSPLHLRLGIRWREGAAEVQVDKGPWAASEADWKEQLRSRKASRETLLNLDPDGDLPWSVALRMKHLLQTWGFKEISYISPGFLLEGPVETTTIGKPEAEAWARSIEKAVLAGDDDLVLRSLYRDELLRRTIGSLRFTVGMRVNIGRMTDPALLLGPPTPREDGQTPALHYVSLLEVEGGFRPLFRLLRPDRLDYLAFVLGKTADGTLRIVDLYSMTTGECLSDTVRSNYLRYPESLEFLNMLKAPVPSDMTRGMGKAGEMMLFLFDDKPKEALEFYDKNAAALKTDKVAHRLRINIAKRVGVPEYLRALEEFERDLPGDPAHTFLRVERYVLAHDLKQGLAAVDALERVVQKDAFLDVVRAQLHLAAQDYASARTCAERATVSEPTLDRGWWVTITACLAQKDHAATVRFFTAAEQALKITLEDPKDNPAYAEFVKSPEYREWIRSRK